MYNSMVIQKSDRATLMQSMTVYISNQSQSNTSRKQHCQMFKMKHDITLLETLTFSLVEKALNCICLIPGRKKRKAMTSL